MGCNTGLLGYRKLITKGGSIKTTEVQLTKSSFVENYNRFFTLNIFLDYKLTSLKSIFK